MRLKSMNLISTLIHKPCSPDFYNTFLHFVKTGKDKLYEAHLKSCALCKAAVEEEFDREAKAFSELLSACRDHGSHKKHP